MKSGNFFENRKEFVLFCDSLSSQVIDKFLEALKIINGIVWFDDSGAADIWQPVDQYWKNFETAWLQNSGGIAGT